MTIHWDYHLIFGEAVQATRLVMVSQEACPPCEKMKPVIDRLAAEGYDAQIVMLEDFAGPPAVHATPTLLFYGSEKGADCEAIGTTEP